MECTSTGLELKGNVIRKAVCAVSLGKEKPPEPELELEKGDESSSQEAGEGEDVSDESAEPPAE